MWTRWTMRHGFKVPVLVLGFLLVACQATPTRDQDATPDATSTAGGAAPSPGETEQQGELERLYEEAQAEGSFEFWGAEDTELMEEVFAAFRERYPGIEPSHTQLGPVEVTQQALAAAAAGQPPPADILNINLLQGGDVLVGEGILNEDPDWDSYGIPEEIQSAAGGLITQIGPYGLAYNTDLVNEADMPTTWEDLVDPQWEGQLSLDPRGPPWNILVVEWGEDQTLDYLDRLIQTVDPVIIRGSTAGLTNLIAGETSIRPAFLHEVRGFQEEGAPIDWVWVDPVPVEGSSWYLAEEAENPNAAKLFMIWFASEEAQDIQFELTHRRNVISADIPDGFETVQTETLDDIELARSVTTRLTEMLGPEDEG